MTKDEAVTHWLNDPITIEYLARLANEATAARENALSMAAQNDPKAGGYAGAAGAYRWAMEGVVDQMRQGSAKEVARSAEAYPEELHSRRLADALPAGE